jgi:hypothetical protein
MSDEITAEAASQQITNQLQLQKPSIRDNYNNFCRVVERLRTGEAVKLGPDIPEAIYQSLKQAAVFEFEAQEYTAALTYAREQMPDAELHFPPAMPFDPCLLVDDISCTLLHAVEDFELGKEEPDPQTREEIMKLVPEGAEYTPYVLRRGFLVTFCYSYSDVVGCAGWVISYVAFFQLNPVPGRRNWSVVYSSPLIVTGFTEKDSEITVITSGDVVGGKLPREYVQVYDATCHQMEQHIQTSFEQLAYIDLPRHHVVREERILTPRQQRQRATDRHLPRHSEVTKYRLVVPEAIRNIYLSNSAEGPEAERHTVPHGRRGYTRYLTSPRYKNKQWHRIKVRPTWIGSEQWEFGKLRYRVIRREEDLTATQAVTV